VTRTTKKDVVTCQSESLLQLYASLESLNEVIDFGCNFRIESLCTYKEGKEVHMMLCWQPRQFIAVFQITLQLPLEEPPWRSG